METNNQSSRVSSYLEYLPAIQQADPFLGRFLLAFERILSGLSSAEPEVPFPKQHGLEEDINSIYTYFNPGIKEDSDTAQSEFLPWLAGWVALSLRDEWGDETKRQFISKIVPLYRRRGTKAGLKEILELYLESSNLPKKVEVFEFDDPPHYFQVQVTLPDPDLEKYWQQARIAKAIIDQEKPAHTYYALKILIPTMRLTGQSYSVPLEKNGEITASVEQETDEVLVLSIKGSPAQAEPYKREIGRKTVRVSHSITPEEFAANKVWYVNLANLNLSNTKVKGKMTITVNYADADPKTVFKNKPFELSSGLKIYKQSEKGKPIEGNTLLGTQQGTIEQYKEKDNDSK
ncbi:MULTISPECIES: phage tail protein [unclassified Microcoleus]|uniref:phage tail protein n=1 Tax=unclassified Microcoleus TaxID=2642155 RepID=UPI002FD326A1